MKVKLGLLAIIVVLAACAVYAQELTKFSTPHAEFMYPSSWTAIQIPSDVANAAVDAETRETFGLSMLNETQFITTNGEYYVHYYEWESEYCEPITPTSSGAIIRSGHLITKEFVTPEQDKTATIVAYSNGHFTHKFTMQSTGKSITDYHWNYDAWHSAWENDMNEFYTVVDSLKILATSDCISEYEPTYSYTPLTAISVYLLDPFLLPFLIALPLLYLKFFVYWIFGSCRNKANLSLKAKKYIRGIFALWFLIPYMGTVAKYYFGVYATQGIGVISISVGLIKLGLLIAAIWLSYKLKAHCDERRANTMINFNILLLIITVIFHIYMMDIPHSV